MYYCHRSSLPPLMGQCGVCLLLLLLLASALLPNGIAANTRPSPSSAAAVTPGAAAAAAKDYPGYCLREWTVEQHRTVPPLSAEAQALHLRLQQVHALVRHGARAPYDRNCWKWAAAAAAAGVHTAKSSSSSSSRGSGNAPKHVGFAPEQDALRSDTERCPPTGHSRHGDCPVAGEAAAPAPEAAAAAAAAAEAAAATASPELESPQKRPPGTREETPLRDTLSARETPLTAAAAAAAAEPRELAAAEARGSRDRSPTVAKETTHTAAANATETAAADEIEPPWECAIQEELGMNDSRSGRLSTPLLLKTYVAAEEETGLFRNSCVPSSLLNEGQTQLRIVGSILSKAYIEVKHRRLQQQQDSQQQQDNRQQQQQQQLVHALFTAEELHANVEDHLKVRSTDISRTLASGAFLLESLFGTCGVSPQRVSVALHEITLDPLLSGYNSPEVLRLREQAESTPEFAALTAKHKHLKQQLREELRLSIEAFEALWPEVIVDCALTYVCTDRSHYLPAVLQNGNFEMLQQLLHFNNQISNFWLNWGQGAAAYASARPLFIELTHNILKPINRKQQQQQQHGSSSSSSTAAARNSVLSLYMTHDVTLISLLAALRVYGGVWPPYASAVIFEVYEHLPPHPPSSSSSSSSSGAVDGKYLFRLIYNGEILTAKMPGCSGESLPAPDLCNLEVLIERMQTPPPPPPFHQQQQQQQQQHQRQRQEEM